MQKADQKKWLYGIFGMALLILFGIWVLFTPGEETSGSWNEGGSGEGQEEVNTEETESDVIYVHLTGAVRQPGVLKLKKGARMIDAVDAAGGLWEDADTESINLAAVLKDAEKIHIFTISEREEQQTGTGVLSDGRININQASLDELMTLPGIGEGIGQSIIDYRTENGNFSSLEDLKKVDRIGERTFDKLKDKISL